MENFIKEFAESWANKTGNVNTTEDILSWVNQRNETVFVDINKITPDLENDFWYYNKETGEIANRNNSFFSIRGIEIYNNGEFSDAQPILIQDEVGYLGIICQKINGVLNFLMQAKIEPGNINKIQISPTIQATKSNFTQKHGGKKPPYVDYFINSKQYEIIVDQLQSEQSSRFMKKRNRNIIIMVSENEKIDVLPSHKWMTLGQLKQLMRYENLVNMDTRTVLSCIPFYKLAFADESVKDVFNDISLYNSIINTDNNEIQLMYNYINDYKMFSENQIKMVPLMPLKNWTMTDGEYVCNKPYNFKVVFCDIAIEGREVTRWQQPLFEATGIATFGLFTCVQNGVRKFLVKCRPEFGCFDKIEIGPTIQHEAILGNEYSDLVEETFFEKYKEGKGVLHDVILSEEGGRFYHEQNKNIIIEINENIDLPEGYFWASYNSLNMLNQVNNCLNIQLRNLLSLLEV